jgi:hypothetical protein
MNKFLGFTLIEILLTLFLSSFILLSLTAIFLASQKNADVSSALMQLQDNIDVASSVLTSAIQTANTVESYQGHELKPGSEGFSVDHGKSFFVGKTDRILMDGSPMYAFYVKDQQGKHELIENVLDMQILYSYLDHGILKEVKFDEMSNGNSILGVSITLLFSSMHLKKLMYVYAALHP